MAVQSLLADGEMNQKAWGRGVLLFGDEVRATPRLTLPHPRMHERAFVLKPLLEIAPDAQIPGHGSAADCLGALAGQPCEKVGG